VTAGHKSWGALLEFQRDRGIKIEERKGKRRGRRKKDDRIESL
jgi:hypothetical protein